MKKSVLILCNICLCLILTSCGFRGIKYNGDQNIYIVLNEDYALDVSSADELTFTSDNNLYVTVSPDGIIHGKNIGEANITISNSHEEITIHVTVSLFEEPSLDFGCSPQKIASLHGEPRLNFGDTIYRYGGGNYWYSYATWQMDYFFSKMGNYYESHLYIRNDLNLLLTKYLDEKYYYYQALNDTINGEVKTLHIYLDTEDPKFADVIVGKQYNVGTYDDILLIYAPAEAIITQK
jgi:hypothetical protein